MPGEPTLYPPAGAQIQQPLFPYSRPVPSQQAPEVRRVDFYTASDIPLFKFVSSLDKGAPIGQNASKSCLVRWP